MNKESVVPFVNIGFGNILAVGRIVAIVSPESAPIKRMIAEGREKSVLVDATHGRRTRAVVVTDSGHLVLSAILPETIGNRLGFKQKDFDIEIDKEETQ